LTSKQRLWNFPVGAFPHYLAFNPLDSRLAVCRDTSIRIYDCATGAAVDLPHPFPFENVAWHPGGDNLAAVSHRERRIYLWDVAARRPTATLEGYKNGGVRLAFDSSGDILASTGWEWMLRFWDPRTGKQMFRTPALFPCMRVGGPKGWLAAEIDGAMLRFLEATAGREYRTLHHSSSPGDGVAEYYGGTIDSLGRLLAVSMRDGVRVWDLGGGNEIAFLPLGYTAGVCFQPSGALLTSGPDGVLEWPVHAYPASPGSLRVGPPAKHPLYGSFGAIASSVNGKVVAGMEASGAYVWHRGQANRLMRLGPQKDVRAVAVSPDGRWVATGSHGGPGAKVWDAKSGRLVKDLPVGGMCHVAFSPDGKWLATGGGGCRLWSVGSWEEGPVIGGVSSSTFSPDGRLLAIDTGTGAVRLVDTETGQEVARFDDPNQDRASWLGFAPDGTRLLTTNNDTCSIHVWDLRSIRLGLAALDLDWKPAHQDLGPPSRANTVLQMQVEMGRLKGDAFAANGQWSKAASEYAQALERNPDEWYLWYAQLMTHVALKDRTGYRRDCNQALTRFGKSADPEILAWIAWACAVWPDADTDPAAMIELAQKARTADPKSYLCSRVLGATLMRAGRLEAALRCLDEALKSQEQAPMTWLLMALAQHRSGHPTEARQWLDKASRWLDAPERAGQAARGYLPWTERLALRHLRAEIETALQESAGD
jgi:WD40 repeat protein/Flp pilus assembly protein TadD